MHICTVKISIVKYVLKCELNYSAQHSCKSLNILTGQLFFKALVLAC